MKIAECSSLDRQTLAIVIIDFLEKELNSHRYRLGGESDEMLYDTLYDALTRVDIHSMRSDE